MQTAGMDATLTWIRAVPARASSCPSFTPTFTAVNSLSTNRSFRSSFAVVPSLPHLPPLLRPHLNEASWEFLDSTFRSGGAPAPLSCSSPLGMICF